MTDDQIYELAFKHCYATTAANGFIFDRERGHMLAFARALLAASEASAEPDLSRQIMNLPCVTPTEYGFIKFGENEQLAYKLGHRDARHAAVGLAIAPRPADYAALHLTPEQAAKEAK